MFLLNDCIFNLLEPYQVSLYKSQLKSPIKILGNTQAFSFDNNL